MAGTLPLAVRTVLIFKKRGGMGGIWPAATRRTPHAIFCQISGCLAFQILSLSDQVCLEVVGI
jgi:hypothetical protein